MRAGNVLTTRVAIIFQERTYQHGVNGYLLNSPCYIY
jgi:hypothetical protein